LKGLATTGNPQRPSAEVEEHTIEQHKEAIEGGKKGAAVAQFLQRKARRVDAEADFPAGYQDATYFRQSPGNIHIRDGHAGDDAIEAGVGKWQRFTARALETPLGIEMPRHRNLFLVDVNANNLVVAAYMEGEREFSRTASQV
jgi:hypothetical protein